MDDMQFVSVPSRGILFPNKTHIYLIAHTCYVSVPSRGILFPNFEKERVAYVIAVIGFRPLSGYLISKS